MKIKTNYNNTNNIGSSDHLLVWMELGRASKASKKRKCVIRRWHVDRFGDDEVKLSYQNALMVEVHEFSESTKNKIESITTSVTNSCPFVPLERHEGARIGD